MATVRLTYNLKSEVLSNINNLYTQRIHQAQTNLVQNTVLGDAIYNHVIPQAQQLALTTLGDGWTNKAEHIVVRFDITKDKNTRSHTYSIRFSKARPVPISMASSYRPFVSIAIGHPCYNELLTLHEEIESIINERDELTSSISRMMNQCGSLRQLLEIWPSALEYMPQRVIVQHSAKPTKKEKAEIVPPDERTQVLLLKARMLKT